MTRLIANQKIVEKIQQMMYEYPDLRFGQILRNLGIVKEIEVPEKSCWYWKNDFYTESETILNRIENECFNRIKRNNEA